MPWKQTGPARGVWEKGASFQVFFTGHSLGGWLAQITTFTTKFLKVEGNDFLKSDNVPHSFHPHTVVFDSPGCKDMLSQMTDKFDVRLEGRSIDLEQLDITSYLSAPNRINTCNFHAGTVYRIFTNLSDMGWLEKHTAMYNSVTHSIDKIVDFFDPEKGQIHKDEQGKLKIQVVVDWPVAAGLFRGEEYKSFFTWAKDFNNYHPEDTDKTFQLKGYHSIRYQTKTYDERVFSLNVFCLQERQFLESYRWLRQLPEFFKPKELFCVMADKQAQEQAEKLLQGFEIENDRVRCTDASELQALIPYVKRLLELFPQLGENTNGVLTPQQIRNNVYQFVTNRYVETLRQSPLDFKPDALSLRDFLNSDELRVLQLRIADGDAWTGLIKVYQVLEKTPSMTDRLSQGRYTILTLEHLLHFNQLVNLNTLMESTTAPHLLMMSCETNQLLNVETEQILRSLFNALSQKESVKIILTTQSEHDTVTFLQGIAKETVSDGFVTRDEQLIWSDLTPSSQEELQKKTLKFQGFRISVNEIMSAESLAANLPPLSALLEEKELTIADPVPITDGYNESYYIGRTLRHQKDIKKDTLNDKSRKYSPGFITFTDQGSKKVYRLKTKRNLRFEEKDKSGRPFWQQSQGSLEKLRRYNETEISHTYTPEDLDKLFEQAQHQRVMLISDVAGMGKSTLLTHLSTQIKGKFPAKWVVRINLNDHTNVLEALRKEQIDKEKAIEFVSERLLKLKPGLEMELFKQCCEQEQKVRVVMMLDGFDEISPSYKDTVIELLQALRQTAVEQLWVTTRPHLRQELEEKLQQLSYTLEPFSEDNQVEFLTNFWSLKGWLIEMDSKDNEEKKIKLATYAKHLIKKLAQSIGDEEKELTGIPLQCRMLAEAFDEEVRTFCQSAETTTELPFQLDLIGLYKRFIERKYDIYQKEKFQVPLYNVVAIEQRERDLKSMREEHQLLALKVLFTEEQVALFEGNKQYTFSAKELTRVGIVQVSHEGNLHFIHRTFAEYYVADILVKQLTEGSKTSQQVQDLLLQKIFLKNDYRMIRVFIDGLLSRTKPSNEVLRQYGHRMSNLEDGVPLLHGAARERNNNIAEFLLDSVQAGEHIDALNELLLARDHYERTAWHLAAELGNTELLETIWKLAKQKLKKEEIRNNLLLGIINGKKTAWQLASRKGNKRVLEKLWEWAGEELTPGELKNKLFLAKCSLGRIAWQDAALEGNTDFLDKVWEWVKEEVTPDEFCHKLLLGIDLTGTTVWHNAVEKDNAVLLEKLWVWAKQKLTPGKLIYQVLLGKSGQKESAWHMAAEVGNIKLQEKLWEWANETLTSDELNNALLLSKDKKKRTAWHLAAEHGNVQLLEKLWGWAKEKLTTDKLKNELLFAKVRGKKTAWDVAAVHGDKEVLLKLYDWAADVLTPAEMRSKSSYINERLK
jgi:ankyrin repeat protein